MNDSIDAVLASMTLEQKIGQLLAIGFDGLEADPELLDLVERCGVGGVIFFARNVDSPAQVAALTNSLQSAALRAGHPGLLLAVDQEGGRVARFTEEHGFTEFPSAMALGATGQPENARLAAAAIAREMRAVGLNADFAPVLDVNNNAANPVIGTRSFGYDPQLVARFGTAFIAGLQSEDVLAFGKHFPGHGDTNKDSHFTLPTVSHDLRHLEEMEFVPFRAAVSAGVGAIMAAHINFTAVEPSGLPGSLSPKVMTGLIRAHFGYTGLLATDSLEMGALGESGYPVPLAAATAVQAGADLLLFNRDHALHRQALAEILAWVQQGRIPMERIDAAARRVLAAKRAFNMLNPLPADAAAAAQVCGSREHHELSRALADQSVRLVRQGSAPRPIADGVLLEIPEARGLAGRLGIAALATPENPTAEEIAAILAKVEARAYPAAVLPIANGHNHNPGQLNLAHSLAGKGLALVVVILQNPLDAQLAPESAAVVTVYGNNPPAFDALVKTLQEFSV